jgi:hypothetical protein
MSGGGGALHLLAGWGLQNEFASDRLPAAPARLLLNMSSRRPSVLRFRVGIGMREQ